MPLLTAITSPLLQDANIKGSQGLLVNVTGPSDMTIHELNDASSIIYEESGEDANVILGCVIDEKLTDEIHITVIATGLNNDDYHPNKIHYDNTIYSTNNDVKTEYINKESENNTEEIKVEKKNEDDNNKDIMTFGDNLDVPAFMRNKNS